MSKLFIICFFALMPLVAWGQDSVAVHHLDEKTWKKDKDTIAVYQLILNKDKRLKFGLDAIYLYNKANFVGANFESLTHFGFVAFESEANFRRAKFKNVAFFYQTKFESEVNFNNAKFESEAVFSSAAFDSLANFSFAKFESLADFNSAKFKYRANFMFAEIDSLADFRFAKFESLAYFLGATFGSKADFSEAEFKSRADFIRAKFKNVAFFYQTKFESEVNFSNAAFESEVNFSEAEFESRADFIRAKFKNVAFFYQTKFESEVNFSNAKFESLADFSEAGFKGTVDFNAAQMPDTLIFDKISEIAKEIDFTVAKVDSGKTCYINLVKTKIGMLRIKYGKFKPYFHIDTDPEDIENVYLMWLKKLKDDGFTKSYELLDIEYKQFQYEIKENNKWLWKQICWLDKVWWNYGYNKELIFKNTAFIFLFFFLINWLIYYYLVNEVYEIKSINFSDKTLYKIRYIRWDYNIYKYVLPPLRSLPSSFFYTCLVFFGLKMSYENINYKNKWAVFYLFFQFVLGILCLAYLANYIVKA